MATEKLKKGEYQRGDKGLYFTYITDPNTGKRRCITGKTIESMRAKKAELSAEIANNIRHDTKSVDGCYYNWLDLKRGIVNHTKANYQWLYVHYAEHSSLGTMDVKAVTKGTIKNFYNHLRDQKGLAVTTIDGLHTVLRQVFQYAVDERYILTNPADGAITEIKRQSPKKQAHPALTKAEQDRFLSFIEDHPLYSHWFPVFKVMIGTGMRVAEITGLRWKDLDLEAGTITIDHGLTFYKDMETGRMKYRVGKPKTKASTRTVVMLAGVKEAFLLQKEWQEKTGIECRMSIEGTDSAPEATYTDFIFCNRFGEVQHQGTLNKAIKRIIRDANVEAMDNPKLTVLPPFSCHCLRSTYITRAAEMYVPVEVTMQQVGHDDKETTLRVYTTVHPDWRQRELKKMDKMFD